MKTIIPVLSLVALALSSCGVNTPVTSSTVVPKRGMTKEQIKTSLGTPGYQYDVNSQETWVYHQGNQAVAQAKSTALNLVPIVGPLISLASSIKPSTQTAISAITFDKEGKVSRIEQSE